MSPLMQTLCDHLCECCLDRYIDGSERDIYTVELSRLYKALSAVLPESCRALPDQYSNFLALRTHLEMEAMFQAAFAAARELG